MKDWEDIQGFEGRYKINKKGEIYSLISNKKLKQTVNGRGYLKVLLYDSNKNTFCRTIHTLVAQTYLNYKINGKQDNVVDHIDNNKLNNHLSNLQVITQTKNIDKDRFRRNLSSKVRGISYYNKLKKWVAQTYIKNKRIYIGSFDTENSAIEALNKFKKMS